LKVGVYDKLRDIGNTGYIIIDKRNTSSAQNFKLISKENKAPYFTNYIGTDDSIKIQVNKEVSFLYISMQQEKLPLPQPPFSSEAEPTFTFMADSVWKIPYKMSNWYRFPYKGLYFIQNDSVAGEGVYLCNFGNAFPRVIDVKSMVSPIEYLSTTEEFKKLGNDENIKLAVDNFWLSLSSNKEDSRELIRIFYARMHYANLYFTSYKPGWKTDRGMIYMIFGPPSYINKTFDSETWEYYLKQDSKDLLIKFVKTRSLYSDNHFVMQRDASFTPFWREAVYSWRNGKAYSLEE
jgi:GWxTD domain-containing protein